MLLIRNASKLNTYLCKKFPIKKKLFFSAFTTETQSENKNGVFSYSTKLINYSRIIHVKQLNFGKELQSFKQAWEEPLVNQYSSLRKINKKFKSERKIEKETKQKKREEKVFNSGLWKTNYDTLLNVSATKEPHPIVDFKENFNPNDPDDEDSVNKLVDNLHSMAESMDDEDEVESTGKKVRLSKDLPSAVQQQYLSKMPIYTQFNFIRDQLKEGNFNINTTLTAPKTAAGLNAIMHPRKLFYKGKRVDLSLYDPRRPSTLLPIAKKEKIKKKRTHRQIRVDPNEANPIVFTETDFPLYSEDLKGDPNITRKSKMQIYLPALRLPPPVLKRLTEITGNRIKKGVLTLVSVYKPTIQANQEYVINKLKELLSEAWTADLNYVPVQFPVLPHQQVEKELRDEAIASEIEKVESIENYKVPGKFTFFLLPRPMLPDSDWKEKRTEDIKKMIQESCS